MQHLFVTVQQELCCLTADTLTLRNNITEGDVRTFGKYGLKTLPLIESFLLLQTKTCTMAAPFIYCPSL